MSGDDHTGTGDLNAVSGDDHTGGYPSSARRSTDLGAPSSGPGHPMARLADQYAEVIRERDALVAAREDSIARGRRMVPDPERFPPRLPDYAMRTAQGHPPIPEQYRWSPPRQVEEDYSI